VSINVGLPFAFKDTHFHSSHALRSVTQSVTGCIPTLERGNDTKINSKRAFLNAEGLYGISIVLCLVLVAFALSETCDPYAAMKLDGFTGRSGKFQG